MSKTTSRTSKTQSRDVSLPSTPLSEDLARRFSAIVGERYAIRPGADSERFLSEPRGLFRGAAALVLLPANVAEVSQILRLANETSTVIVPQGGNTGLVGGQIPDTSGRAVILNLSRLTALREIDTVNNTVTVEAGMVLARLQDIAKAEDRLFPLSLGAQGSCQIGGNLAANAGGTGALAYGSARDLCLGIEFVLPSGEIVDDLRKLKKDNTGYDLKNLVLGSEGTLGVITAAVLRLYPRPKGAEVAWAAVNSPAEALRLYQMATAMAGGALTAFELMTDLSVKMTTDHLPSARVPLIDPSPWHVLIEISSNRSMEDAAEQMQAILSVGFEAGIIQDATLAMNLGQAQAFWTLREAMSEAQRYAGASIKHDISVPVSAIPDFLAQATGIVEQVSPGARVACFGHMGDGNMHYNISQPIGANQEDFLGLYPQMTDAVHQLVRRFNGSISAEHGIGQMKRGALQESTPPAALELMRGIKSVFDPKGIMNPGKVL